MNLHLKILHGKQSTSRKSFKATDVLLREAITINLRHSRCKLTRDAMIIVIDYDAGILQMFCVPLKKSEDAELFADKEKKLAADGLIFTWVRRFIQRAMAELGRRGLVAVIKGSRTGSSPLGICLGMQILTGKGLEHEETDGLGIIPGVCCPIPASKEQPVPLYGVEMIWLLASQPL